MSTKTLRKRIALATVAALGAGVLSLVSTTAANAAANGAAGGTNATAAAGVLNIAVATSSTGAGVVSTTDTSNQSQGLLSVGDIAGGSLAGTTQTATLLSNGSLVVYTSLVADASANSANQVAVISVSGGTVSGATTPATSYIAYNSGLTAVSMASTAGGVGAVIVKPNSGATSMTISMYNGSGYSSSGTWAAALGAATASASVASPTTGTLNGQITVTIASSSSAGVVSTAKSGVYYSNDGNAVTGSTEATTAITGQPAIGTSYWNVKQYATLVAKDAYGAALGAGHLIQASASNGAYVNVASTTSNTATPTMSTSFYSTTSATQTQYGITVLPTVSTGTSTVVTVSVDGVVVGTKSFNFYGKVAKVKLSAAGNGLKAESGASTNGGNTASIAFYDAAGNSLSIGTSGNTASFASNSVTSNSATSNATLGTVTYPDATSSNWTGYLIYGCTPAASKGSLTVDFANVDGTVVTSNALPVSCSGSPDTYSAKLDKSTYKPGEIATLTVTFNDSKGNLAADVYTYTAAGAVSTSGIAGSGATALPNITGSNLTNTSGTSTTAGTSTDVTTNGVVKYKFIVGTTAGSYQLLVDFPKIDGADASAVTVPYTIADGSTSLNDVLKGIVDLIASINKQIAALAKLVTKKK